MACGPLALNSAAGRSEPVIVQNGLLRVAYAWNRPTGVAGYPDPQPV